MNIFGGKLVTIPPPSAGGVALISLLRTMEQLNYQDYPKTQQKQFALDAMKLVYEARARFLGDPDFVEVPVAQLTSTAQAKKYAAVIQNKTLPQFPQMHVETGENTTHFSIIDKEGNRVAATLSLNYSFGSGFMIPSYGLLLNNQISDFANDKNQGRMRCNQGNDHYRV